MERLVYAVFQDHATAQGAVDDLLVHGVPHDVIDVMMHEGRVDEGQLAGSAGRSRRYGLVGGLVIGVLGAVVGGVVAGTSGAALGLLWGGLAGAIATAIVGGAEAKPSLTRLVEQVRGGRVLVTVDMSGKKQAGLDVERFLESHGALQVGIA
jgi:hypothetical protein